jgi:4-carboxymuconolactone decarboxylase
MAATCIEGGFAVNKEVHDRGLAIRREVLGSDYVDAQLKAADDFNRPFQEFITEYCWGAVWGRPGLPKKTRSIVNLAMLTALGKPQELKIHVKGALKNGCTKDEIMEVLMQTAVYCGVPAAVDAFRTAREAFKEAGA